jgi:hypothetical protein
MSMYILLTFLIAAFLSIANAQDPACYSIAGVEVDGLFSCNPSAENSVCCSPGDICYSNGLCAPSQEYINAGAAPITPFFWNGCTDPTFQDSSCFPECHSGQSLPNLNPHMQMADMSNSPWKRRAIVPSARCGEILLLWVWWLRLHEFVAGV